MRKHPERRALLDALDFVWDAEQQSRLRFSTALREYVAEYGHARVPKKFVTADGYKLGRHVAWYRWSAYGRQRKLGDGDGSDVVDESGKKSKALGLAGNARDAGDAGDAGDVHESGDQSEALGSAGDYDHASLQAELDGLGFVWSE